MNSYIIEDGDISNGAARLNREESRHAALVMRLKPGEEIVLTNGAGKRYAARAEICEASGVTARITGELPANESPCRVTALIGSLKSDKLEFLTQKLTELGASAIIPVKMERCVALPQAGRKGERLEKIAREALKQSKRSLIPDLRGMITWQEALEILASAETAIMPWENARGTRVRDVCRENPASRDIAVLIGPEGGISEAEAQQASGAGAKPVTLGPRILRAETAAIAAVALVQSLWGDL